MTARALPGGVVSKEAYESMVLQIIELTKSRKIRPPEIEVFKLADAATAQDKISTGHVRGKLILKVK